MNNTITSDLPLVSIIVITYNSAKYVLETLESAKAQTFENIELIVSDDSSSDNTVEICRNWIEANKERFVRTELISIEKNAGIPANCNRGVKAAHGEWVKLIAGDDILDAKCIQLNIEYINTNLNAKVVISNIVTFQYDSHNIKNGKKHIPNNLDTLKGTTNAKIQYRALLYQYFGNSPSLFILKAIITEIGYDENIQFMEDFPFALNATKLGYTFNYLDAVTVYYRFSDKSVYGSKSSRILFNDFYKKRHLFDKIYRYPFLPKKLVKMEIFEYYRLLLFDNMGINRNNVLCRLIYKTTFHLNPHKYF